MSPTSGIYWVDLGFINNYKAIKNLNQWVETISEEIESLHKNQN